MKRYVIITVGKTHSGKSTFAKLLNKQLTNSIIVDQDNHAEFINQYYSNLQPKSGPNILKHAVSKLVVAYAVEHTNDHLIICNSNRNKIRRQHLIQWYRNNELIPVIVHFDIPDDVLLKRVQTSTRKTNIFRFASNFEEVLARQCEDAKDDDIQEPNENEADYFFRITHEMNTDLVIHKIQEIVSSQFEN
ncbi:ATP-binding protein [Oceanobacillus kimchii]|uniref:ATP-binding protein n=1 Tax=Oceanobacillus kimchii TaxID=746691 RepID=UPI0021A84B62|nr:ATP-binding protein [Oceanobacillus kimchii]MCT1578781.1 ATP-binding protein [Oceanobacillus kimchii]MCT2137769.1 ATP-binding protein [Oceanobacillus kimchii]